MGQFDVNGFYNEQHDTNGFYHQDDRDAAAGLGCVTLALMALAIVAIGVIAFVYVNGGA